jgi:hypothetical protein
MSTIRISLADGVDGASPHHDASSAELFSVLDGTAQLLSGEQLLTAGKGDLVVVPPSRVACPGCSPASQRCLRRSAAQLRNVSEHARRRISMRVVNALTSACMSGPTTPPQDDLIWAPRLSSPWQHAVKSDGLCAPHTDGGLRNQSNALSINRIAPQSGGLMGANVCRR